MQSQTNLIQDCINKIGAKSYLELGINKPNQNHWLINCDLKIGVDINPESRASFTGSTDDFFKINQQSFDVIFCDALHHASQVRIDFENSLLFLNEGGIIILHDTDPKNEDVAREPRNGLRGKWNGTVYKFIPELCRYPVEWKSLEGDENGFTIIKIKRGKVCYEPGCDINFEDFVKRRKEILNLVSKSELLAWI